jgi:MFS superfamily sulfate permease-like transporter
MGVYTYRFAGALVLLALAFLTPLFYYIPHASLGVVIIMAVIDTITFHKLWIFWKTKR